MSILITKWQIINHKQPIIAHCHIESFCWCCQVIDNPVPLPLPHHWQQHWTWHHCQHGHQLGDGQLFFPHHRHNNSDHDERSGEGCPAYAPSHATQPINQLMVTVTETACRWGSAGMPLLYLIWYHLKFFVWKTLWWGLAHKIQGLVSPAMDNPSYSRSF